MKQPDQIRCNAQNGVGPCKGCDAHEKQQGELVNPGLFDPTSDLVFMTDEPRHPTDWDEYDNWVEYNEDWSQRVASGNAGNFIPKLLEPFDYTIHDIWMGDSIKCPTEAVEKWDVPNSNTRDAFNHCQSYLTDELRTGGGGDRRLIVTLGKPATIRTHRALGVPPSEANNIRIKQDYGHSQFDTTPPIVICPHWNAWMSRDEYIPVVQDAMADILA
jgi:hypothetical protein